MTLRSELIALKTDDLDSKPDGTLRVVTHRSKADPFGVGRIAFTSTKTASLVRDWLEWRGPHITYLNCLDHQNKALQRSLGTTSVKDLIKTSARAAGFDTVAIMRAAVGSP